VPIAAERRFFSRRFGMRAMFWAVAAVAVACAIVTGMVREGWRHDQIAARLLKAGGYAYRSDSVTPGKGKLPDWLESIRGMTPFRRITHASLDGSRRDGFDGQLSVLAELGSVPIVSADAGNDSNAPVVFGIQELNRLMSQVRVDTLEIQSAQLPRGRIPAFSRQPLSRLSVRRTQFSNPAIEDLPLSLTYFDATRTRITDEGLASFTRLKKLRSLSLRRTPTTPEAVERLREQMPWCHIRAIAR
jgi:hypothetical protein